MTLSLLRYFSLLTSLPPNPFKTLLHKTKNAKKIPAAEIQKQLLLTILNNNKHTLFGRKHSFSHIKRITEYQKYIPLSDHHQLQFYWQEMEKNPNNILFRDKIAEVIPSTGTNTEVKNYYISQTQKEAYFQDLENWLRNLSTEIPDLFDGSILYLHSFTGPRKKYHHGIVVNRYASPNVMLPQSVLAKKQAIPEMVLDIVDQPSRHYLVALFACLFDIRLFMAHTSQSILNILQTINQYSEDMINDISRGSLKNKLVLSVSERAELNKLFKKSLTSERVEFLKFTYFMYRALPVNQIWPNMRLICFWMHGAAGVYKSTIADYFVNATIREYPYIAVEGWFSFPMRGQLQDGLLNISDCFYEFLEIDENNQTMPIPLTIKFLQEEKNYELVVTNQSGLYRYRVGDIITVTGFEDDIPRIVYSQSTQNFCNLVGENLSELQVEKAYNEALKSAEDKFSNLWVLFPDYGTIPGYRLYIEKKKSLERKELEKFLATFEKSLCRKSKLYSKMRENSLLAPVKMFVCSPKSFTDAQNRRQSAQNRPFRFTRFFKDQSQLSYFFFEEVVELTST